MTDAILSSLQIAHRFITDEVENRESAGGDETDYVGEARDAGERLSGAIDAVEQMAKDAARYQYLRSRDLKTIRNGGIFAGMNERKCENCEFSQQYGKRIDDLVCRRFPPSVDASRFASIDGDRMLGVWPTICADDFCGEFRARASTERNEG
jgi:hypothetical protein